MNKFSSQYFYVFSFFDFSLFTFFAKIKQDCQIVFLRSGILFILLNKYDLSLTYVNYEIFFFDPTPKKLYIPLYLQNVIEANKK